MQPSSGRFLFYLSAISYPLEPSRFLAAFRCVLTLSEFSETRYRIDGETNQLEWKPSFYPSPSHCLASRDIERYTQYNKWRLSQSSNKGEKHWNNEFHSKDSRYLYIVGKIYLLVRHPIRKLWLDPLFLLSVNRLCPGLLVNGSFLIRSFASKRWKNNNKKIQKGKKFFCSLVSVVNKTGGFKYTRYMRPKSTKESEKEIYIYI